MLATVFPPVLLGEQSLSRALVMGMAHRGLGLRGLEAKTGTVLREGSLADWLVSRTAQVALGGIIVLMVP